jgi:hypothetical protein
MGSRAGVYVIREMVSNHLYIGGSLHIGQRISGHRTKLRTQTHPSREMLSAYRIVGEATFYYSIIELVTFPSRKKAFELVLEWRKKVRCLFNERGNPWRKQDIIESAWKDRYVEVDEWIPLFWDVACVVPQ